MNQDISRTIRDYATILGMGKRGYRLLKKNWNTLSDKEREQSKATMEKTLDEYNAKFRVTERAIVPVAESEKTVSA